LKKISQIKSLTKTNDICSIRFWTGTLRHPVYNIMKTAVTYIACRLCDAMCRVGGGAWKISTKRWSSVFRRSSAGVCCGPWTFVRRRFPFCVCAGAWRVCAGVRCVRGCVRIQTRATRGRRRADYENKIPHTPLANRRLLVHAINRRRPDFRCYCIKRVGCPRRIAFVSHPPQYNTILYIMSDYYY